MAAADNPEDVAMSIAASLNPFCTAPTTYTEPHVELKCVDGKSFTEPRAIMRYVETCGPVLFQVTLLTMTQAKLPNSERPVYGRERFGGK